MRTFYVFAVICICGTYAKFSDDPTINCIMESNFDLENDLFELTKQVIAGTLQNPSDEFYCYTACLARYHKKFKGSIHDFVMQRIANVDEQGHFENKPYKREDLEDVANRCSRKGLNNCDYFKCVKYLEAPFLQLPYDGLFKQN